MAIKNNKCLVCGGGVNHNAIGLNKKLLDRDGTKFYCLNCLANYLDVTQEELMEKIEDFKSQGCALFE